MTTNWVLTYEGGEGLNNTRIESIDGIEWADAPLPYPWHKCTPQTRGWVGLNYTERCACGGIRLDGRYGHWMEKNATLKSRQRERREAKMPRVQVRCRTCGQDYEAIKDSRQARQELCTSCWGERFVASEGRLY